MSGTDKDIPVNTERRVSTWTLHDGQMQRCFLSTTVYRTGCRVSRLPFLKSFVSSNISDTFNGVDYRCGSFDRRSVCSYSNVSKAGSGSLLAIGTFSGAVKILDTRRKCLSECDPRGRLVTQHSSYISDLKWKGDDKSLLVGTCTHTKYTGDYHPGGFVVTVEERFITHRLHGHCEPVKCVLWHPTNESLVYTGDREGTISLWDLRVEPSVRLSSGLTGIRPVATISHAHKAVKASLEPTITGLVPHDNVTHGVISSCSANGFLRLWDFRSTSQYLLRSNLDPGLYNYHRSRGIVSLVMGIGESEGIVFGFGIDAKIYVYCARDLNLCANPISFDGLGGTTSFYAKMSVSPCGRWLVHGMGSRDGDAFIYSVARDTRLDVSPAHAVRLRGGSSSSYGVDWSYNSLAVCAEAGVVRIWRADPAKRRECEIQPDFNREKWSWATSI